MLSIAAVFAAACAAQVTINLDYLCATPAYDACVAQLARVWQHLPPAAIADVTPSLLSDVLKMPELQNGESVVRFVAAIGRDIDTISHWAAVARPAIDALRYQPPHAQLWRWLSGEEGPALHAAAAALMPPRVFNGAVAETKSRVTLHQCAYCKWIISADKLAALACAYCVKQPYCRHSFSPMTATDAPPA
jgi:hypothetical protein